MNSTTDTHRHPEQPLDGFETALLQELRGVVQNRAEAATAGSLNQSGPKLAAPNRTSPPTRTSPPNHTRRWALPVGIAAAGAAALAIVQPFGGATPAFAVEEQDGAVTVEINRLEGPEDLQEALAEHGITAAVDYPEAGTMCSPDRYVPAATTGGGSVSASSGNGPGAQSGQGEAATVFSITLDPADYVGKTLVLESAWFGDEAWTVGVGTAEGEVGPCDPVPADTLIPQQIEPGSLPPELQDKEGTWSSTTD